MDIIDSIRLRLDSHAHHRLARSILASPPIVPADDGLILFSMIGTKVVLPYLVALKSLHARLGRGRVVLLDDGTLTDADRALLNRHCGGPVFMALSDIACAPCPTGNCWERLLAILDLRRDHYVIQLDSDTVTVGDIPDIADAIARNQSFTLAGGAAEAAAGVLPVADFVRRFYEGTTPDPHIQTQIESRLAGLPDSASVRYVRGCAGFAGFAAGGDGRDGAVRFSQAAEGLVGARWREWGSEQVASNYVIANDPDPLVLPYDRYLNFWNEPVDADARFIHFIGTYRYHGGQYRRATRRAIAHLTGQAAA